MNNINDIVDTMIAKFGKDSQIDVCIEEMSELTQALIKERRTRLYNREKVFSEASKEHIKEEIADVLFMIEYLKRIFSIPTDELLMIIQQKASRTAQRYLNKQELYLGIRGLGIQGIKFPENDEEPISYSPVKEEEVEE